MYTTDFMVTADWRADAHWNNRRREQGGGWCVCVWGGGGGGRPRQLYFTESVSSFHEAAKWEIISIFGAD